MKKKNTQIWVDDEGIQGFAKKSIENEKGGMNNLSNDILALREGYRRKDFRDTAMQLHNYASKLEKIDNQHAKNRAHIRELVEKVGKNNSKVLKEVIEGRDKELEEYKKYLQKDKIYNDRQIRQKDSFIKR